MNLNVMAMNPIAFELGPITVAWYGLIIVVGMIAAIYLTIREGEKRDVSEDFIIDTAFWVLPLGILGARLYYVLFELGYYLNNPGQIFAIWEGGLAIYGGIIAGALTIYWRCKKENVPFALLTDIVTPHVLLAQAIGRWGNFINQEAHGGEVSRQFLEKLMLPEFIIEGMHIKGSYYHPTFLYESIGNVCLFLIITLVIYKIYNRHGQLFFSYFIGYGIIRFFVEALRTDSLMLGPIRMAQLTGIVGALVGIVGVLYLMKKGTKVTDETRMKLF